jgi:hypothetical protein
MACKARLTFGTAMILAITTVGTASEVRWAPRFQVKTFINLALPGAGRERVTPRVLEATDKGATVARLTRDEAGEDIRVIKVEAGQSHYVGRNGRGITGVNWAVLRDTARSPDGRLWILAEDRFPSPVQGNQFCVFVLQNDSWDPVGPRFGVLTPREQLLSEEDHGLHFLSDSRPVAVSIHANLAGEKSSWDMRLRRLECNRWVNLPGHVYQYDRASYLEFVWRAKDAWLIGLRQTAGRTHLEARWIKGPRTKDVVGPIHLDSWAEKMAISHFTVSPCGMIAVVGDKGDLARSKPESSPFMRLYVPAPGGEYMPQDVPDLTSDGQSIDILAWGPTGSLHIVTHTTKGIFVHRLVRGHWIKIGDATNSRRDRDDFVDPHLFFRDDGSPIVTWKGFTPVD